MEVLNKAKKAMFSPDGLFQSVSSESIDSSIKYFAIIIIPVVVLSAIIMVYGGVSAMSAFSALSQPTPSPVSVIMQLVRALGALFIVLMYFGMLSSSFSNTLISHVFVYIMGGRKGFVSTYKTVAYGSTPAILLSWIITLGFFVLPLLTLVWLAILLLIAVWGIVIQVKGVRILHGLSTGRAVLAVLLPLIIMLITIALAGIWAISSPRLTY